MAKLYIPIKYVVFKKVNFFGDQPSLYNEQKSDGVISQKNVITTLRNLFQIANALTCSPIFGDAYVRKTNIQFAISYQRKRLQYQVKKFFRR